MLKVKGKDLVSFLSSDGDSSSGGVHLIAAESDVFRQYHKTFTSSVLANHKDGSKYLIHMVLFDNNVSYYKSTDISKSVIFYDYFNRKFDSLESFYQEFRQNHNPHLRNIVVIDKLNLFNCYCSSSTKSSRTAFFKCLRKLTYKIFLLINAKAATAAELNEAYDAADVIALLMDKQSSQHPHVSYIMKNRPDSKPSLNKVLFEVINDKICQIDEDTTSTTGRGKNDFDMSALTTFKLTLNENEKESKNKLHLPYFDAQRKDGAAGDGELENADIDEDEFDDEEDEEV